MNIAGVLVAEQVPSWTGPISAQAHSQLAGTMAGFALTALTIVLIPFNDRSKETDAARAARADVVRLLIMALVILTLASVEWGALSGLEDTPATDAWISVGAAGCTNLTATGGVIILAAICELVFRSNDRVPYRYALGGFRVVVGLGTFEIVQFALDATVGDVDWLWSLLPPSVGIASFALMWWIIRDQGRELTKILQRRKPKAIGDLVGVAGSALALVAYSLVPEANVGQVASTYPHGFLVTLEVILVASTSLCVAFYFIVGAGLTPIDDMSVFVDLPRQMEPGGSTSQSEPETMSPLSVDSDAGAVDV